MKYDLTLTTTKKYNWTNTCEYIILHNTWWSLVFKNQARYLSEHSHQVSAHYVVWQKWEVAKIWEDDNILWHTWTSEWKWLKDKYNWLNSYAIWIEVVWPWFTDLQRDKVKELVTYLSSKYNISKANILRHKDITPKRKTDIEDSFWNNKYKSWEEYKDSLFNNNKNMWEYERLFTNTYWKWVVFNDLDWAIQKCINKDWTLNTKEFFFLTMIWLERINKKITNNILT